VQILVVAAKAHGWWTLCDAIYPFVGGAHTPHSKNLRANTFNITDSGVWISGITHNANGITGDGTTGFGDTTFTPSTAAGVYLQDSAHISLYLGSTPVPAASRLMMTFGSNGVGIGIFSTGTSLDSNRVNNSMNVATGIFTGDQRGPFFVTRTAATATTTRSRVTISVADTSASTGVPNSSIYLLARNDSGVDQWSTANLRFATIGAGLSAQNMTDMIADLDAYQTTLSRKVP
jgi:hypothetical protein